jgi:hypothetical protein
MKATIRCMPDPEFQTPGAPTTCISGEGESKGEVIWARAY